MKVYPHIESTNAVLSELGISMFFIISGASLYLSMSKYDKFPVGTYIYKRFKGIYPPFWIAYIIAFLYTFVENGGLNPDIPVYRIWLSVVGMDGLTLYAVPNFYLLGEWFLGTIILIYFYFPLLKFLIDKWPKVTWAVVLVLWVVYVYFYDFSLQIDRNPITRVVEIMFGIYYCKYVVLNKNRKKSLRIAAFIICLVVFVLLLFVKIPGEKMHWYLVVIMGITLFYVIAQIGSFINNKALATVVTAISVNSYSIFLVHHIIGNHIADYFKDTDLSKAEFFTCFVLYVALIAVFTIIVNYVSKRFVKLIEMIPKKAE